MASGALNPIDHPNAWDYCTVAGMVCPGWCEVTGWKRNWGWQKKHGKGIQGTVLTYTGKPSAEGTIKFFLTEPVDFANWESFRPLFKYDPTRATVVGVDIVHPAIQDLEIKACVTEDIGQLEHEGLNLWTITVKLIEFTKPPPASAVGTPTGADSGKAGVNPAGPPAPTDPLQIKIAALYQQLNQP